MWRGNPTYDTRQFNATPSINWAQDFLSIVKNGGSTSTVVHVGEQPIPINEEDQELEVDEDYPAAGEQNDIDMVFDPGTIEDERLADPTCDKEEQLPLNEEHDADVHWDLDRDQAMVNTVLCTFDDEEVSYRFFYILSQLTQKKLANI